MSEEAERFALSTAAVSLWTCAIAYAWTVGAHVVPVAWGFAEAVLVAAAATVTIIRASRSTERMLVRVYKAGIRNAEERADDNHARSFSAGMEAGRYERDQMRGTGWTDEDELGRRYDAATSEEEGNDR